MEATTSAAPPVGLRETATKDLSEEIPFKDALMVALAAGMGYGFDAYAVNIYGLVLPAITASLGIGSGTAGVIGSIFLIGYTIGTIGFGVAADRYGRKDTLGVSILMYGLTTSLGGLGGGVVWFTAMRFLTGIGGAGELAVGAPYTCEMFKSKHRALGTGGIMFSLYSLGYILAGVVALVLVPRWGWEWAFIVAIVPALGVFVFRRFISESVRYVVDKAENKMAAAQALLEVEHEGRSAQERAAAVEEILHEETKADGMKAKAHGEAAARHLARSEAGQSGLLSTPALGLLLALALTVLFIGLLADIPKGAAAGLVTGGAVAILFTLALYSLQRGKTERLWQIPGVRKRIGIGWLLYTANAMGYWGITVFLTTFMVEKFGVSPTKAIKYAIMFYVVQFFFSYLGTGLSDRIAGGVPGVRGDPDRDARLAVGCRRHLHERDVPHEHSGQLLRHRGRWRTGHVDLRTVPGRGRDRRVRSDYSVPRQRGLVGADDRGLPARARDVGQVARADRGGVRRRGSGASVTTGREVPGR
jgi:MFS family permease